MFWKKKRKKKVKQRKEKDKDGILDVILELLFFWLD